MAQMPCYNLVRAIKTPFKLLIEGVLIVLGLFLIISPILAASVITDDFETGDHWLTNTCSITTSLFHTGAHSLYCDSSQNFLNNTNAISLANGTEEMWFYATPEAGISAIGMISGGFYSFPDLSPLWLYKSGSAEAIEKFDYTILATTTLSEWHNLTFIFASSTHAVSLFLDDTQIYSSDNFNYSSVDNMFNQGGNGHIYFDDFGLSSVVACPDYQNQISCEANENCAWYFDEWLFQNHFTPYQGCVAKTLISNQCGSDFDTCQYCVSTTTCASQDFCYWFNGTCRYGTGVCGQGLALQLCKNQADCEGAGGYWYSDYCWLSPKPNLLSWSGYYAQYGDYASPTAFISNLASSAGGFFESIGGFLTTFKNFFDLQDAWQKGKDFGSVIPTSRGYLVIFDSFFGSLPISGFFLFLLGFTLAVGVFRVVRHLRQMTKPL